LFKEGGLCPYITASSEPLGGDRNLSWATTTYAQIPNSMPRNTKINMGESKNESTRNPSICMHAMMNKRDEDRVEEQTKRNKKLEPRNAIS
jgi:hypothetical protein